MNTQILIGDCRETLKTLPDETVNCCVTSPPYFGLRDYGHDNQIGLESTPDTYVAEMVAVFREVRRVLRDDGTLWLNIGDSYARQAGDDSKKDPRSINTGYASVVAGGAAKKGNNKPPSGLKPKDLIGIPWLLAFALRADGWYLRQDIIWHKPNPMPESVRDRCTKAHEYIFLLSKSERYYFNAAAIAEPAAYFGKDARSGKGNIRYQGKRTEGDAADNGQQSFVTINETRNKRSVWTVTTKPFKGAHFATFPPDLIRPCILAGCPVGGIVLDPFGGSGTTSQVALENKRNAILCELNKDYVKLINERIEGITPNLL